MRVEKIDIKKESIHVADGQNCFDWIEKPKRKLNLFEFGIYPKAVIPESECLKYKTYNIVEVVDDNYKSKFYGVEQEKLFQDILNISNSALDAIKSKNYQDGLKQGYNEGSIAGWNSSVKHIRKINWLRRLFKLF